MSISISSAEFNRDVSAAKRAAADGPVTITDHGRRAHVLMTVEDYDHLAGERERVGNRLWARQTADVELELEPRQVEEPREAEL
ncbi:type II toxin-antitoxin system prevent-host-death family antitoxin [Propioniferax innocua]|uniref:Antitoxin n=1 Tax=Propioniferax innocua TaxID=1753 RepID=A0A542ZCM4_9ACTN|nr:type II toxin-antitoxin system prevent-host-death family antitoxin [Propioniferax innocua]TQL58000.1 prevent-host-death family protein [Propioniferax innocua]